MLIDAILEKKGHDIVLLDTQEQTIFTDYFLICSGENERQLKALAHSVSQDAKEKANVQPMHIEGQAGSGWVLVDFGDLVVHLFSPDQRSYYDLEGLWDQSHVVLSMQ